MAVRASSGRRQRSGTGASGAGAGGLAGLASAPSADALAGACSPALGSAGGQSVGCWRVGLGLVGLLCWMGSLAVHLQTRAEQAVRLDPAGLAVGRDFCGPAPRRHRLPVGLGYRSQVWNRRTWLHGVGGEVAYLRRLPSGHWGGQASALYYPALGQSPRAGVELRGLNVQRGFGSKKRPGACSRSYGCGVSGTCRGCPKLRAG